MSAAAQNVAAFRARLRTLLRFGPGSPETAPILLRQGRIYLLPTKPGIALGVILVVMLVASINYSLSLGYAFTFLLAGTGVSSVLHAFRNLLQISIQCGRVESAFPGGNVVFHLLIDNPHPQRRPSLRLIGGLAGQKGETSFSLAPASRSEIQLALPAVRRGVLPLNRTVIETRWPLGLVRAWSVIFPNMEALVFPTPENNPPPPLPSSGESLTDWGLLRAGNEDFAGLRTWLETDSPRHLAWKVYARGGEMMTKQFSASGGGDLLLNWDDLPAELSEEARLSRLAAWLLQAEHAGQRTALRMPECDFPAARGEAHLYRCLGALALHGTGRIPP
ncbi:MAG: DUF58 domain-containing protein [Azoarcus sp.]|jgi:uncharacterized protein (DUF58 family)|nr:DUF58 domain-containing protein [Azoarcus sp.]